MPRVRGFTLSEVLLSIGLLSIALLAVIGIFTAVIRYQAQSQERDAANSRVRGLLERIAAEPRVVPPAPRTWIGGEMASTPVDEGPVAFPPRPYPYEAGYAFDVYLEDTTRPGMKLVRVVARWGHGKTLSLQTFVRE